MPDYLSRSLLRSVRWMVDEQRMMLAADEVLCDLRRYRSTLEIVATIANPTPDLLDAVASLESEIAARERMQERARRVVGGGYS